MQNEPRGAVRNVGPETLGVLAPIVEALADAIAAKIGDRDELVAIAAQPLKAHGLELHAVQRLIEDGKLRAVRIGHRAFTKRSALLALVDELPPIAKPSRGEPVESQDDLRVAVAAAARRQQRKAAQVRETAAAHASAA
jgi:hypothetical protein